MSEFDKFDDRSLVLQARAILNLVNLGDPVSVLKYISRAREMLDTLNQRMLEAEQAEQREQVD